MNNKKLEQITETERESNDFNNTNKEDKEFINNNVDDKMLHDLLDKYKLSKKDKEKILRKDFSLYIIGTGEKDGDYVLKECLGNNIVYKINKDKNKTIFNSNYFDNKTNSFNKITEEEKEKIFEEIEKTHIVNSNFFQQIEYYCIPVNEEKITTQNNNLINEVILPFDNEKNHNTDILPNLSSSHSSDFDKNKKFEPFAQDNIENFSNLTNSNNSNDSNNKYQNEQQNLDALLEYSFNKSQDEQQSIYSDNTKQQDEKKEINNKVSIINNNNEITFRKNDNIDISNNINNNAINFNNIKIGYNKLYKEIKQEMKEFDKLKERTAEIIQSQKETKEIRKQIQELEQEIAKGENKRQQKTNQKTYKQIYNNKKNNQEKNTKNINNKNINNSTIYSKKNYKNDNEFKNFNISDETKQILDLNHKIYLNSKIDSQGNFSSNKQDSKKNRYTGLFSKKQNFNKKCNEKSSNYSKSIKEKKELLNKNQFNNFVKTTDGLKDIKKKKTKPSSCTVNFLKNKYLNLKNDTKTTIIENKKNLNNNIKNNIKTTIIKNKKNLKNNTNNSIKNNIKNVSSSYKKDNEKQLMSIEILKRMKQGVKATPGDTIYNDDTYQQITSTMSKDKLFSSEEIKKNLTLEKK